MPLHKTYHCLIHLPISRESNNESYCEQAFRLIDRCVPPPSRFAPVTMQAQARLWSCIIAAAVLNRHSQRILFSFRKFPVLVYPGWTQLSICPVQMISRIYSHINICSRMYIKENAVKLHLCSGRRHAGEWLHRRHGLSDQGQARAMPPQVPCEVRK